MKSKRHSQLLSSALLFCLLLSGCGQKQESAADTVPAPPATAQPSAPPVSTPPPKPQPTQSAKGTKTAIPASLRSIMQGVSMPEGASVTFDDLAYLTIPHYNYQGEVTQGHMVVDAALADEILEIFEKLFLLQFPIEQMEPIDYFVSYIDETFDNLDRASMGQNNTSSFYYRNVNGTNRISYHAYGRAIDINPRTNPYCIPSSGYVSPANAYAYADRSQDLPGMIHQGDPVYQIFIEYGWEWGGDWSDEKDYQHFQKP
ncbi:M15 family metallopeptidase [Ructibacterium gallinarum]|uniref:M15 family metallopeptidase n=1 Tax=Ructibacterium gallinarum TaxID=2779355 RepID=A0A9D5R9B8_9FIRM|nr:M15 family metallopeptidase [Ructibacterium gallinarum]MBE5040329.1 M15 family metallopeptidase [Ructibacterium gallinarum]